VAWVPEVKRRSKGFRLDKLYINFASSVDLSCRLYVRRCSVVTPTRFCAEGSRPTAKWWPPGPTTALYDCGQGRARTSTDALIPGSWSLIPEPPSWTLYAKPQTPDPKS